MTEYPHRVGQLVCLLAGHRGFALLYTDLFLIIIMCIHW